MYGSLRFKAGFCEEVDKFIAAEKHAAMLTENKDIIICPCKDCKNLMIFSDVITIREHLIMRGFVPDYIVWIHHGETMVVDDADDDQEDDTETLEYLSQYSNELAEQMDHDFGNEQDGDFGNEQGGDDASGADNDGRAREGDEDDDDTLEEIVFVVKRSRN
jgi:hypothetical protein